MVILPYHKLPHLSIYTILIMFIWAITLLLIINGNIGNAAPVDVDEDERTECGKWVRSNANTDGEKLVGYVNSTEECLSLYYSDPECYKSGATMANIDKTNGYDEATGIDNYGTCWCQFGDTIKVDDDECCITTWAKDCEEQNNKITDECGKWVQSNANSDGEKFVGYVNSTEECLSIYYSDPECYKSGAAMANIDKTNGYDEDTGINNYGTCWCQFGTTVKVDEDECCITTWAKDCEEQKEELLTTDGNCKVDASVYLKAVQDNCKCNDEFSNENCQMKIEDDNYFCKNLAVKSCRDSIASYAEAYRNAENANKPECFEQDPEYRGTQLAEESCKGCPKGSFDIVRTCSDLGEWCNDFEAVDGCLRCEHCDSSDRNQAKCPECNGEECKTTGGKQPDNNCVFPFWFKGTVYETCITVEDDTPWCSTEVDSNGHHVDGQWGYCGEACPGTTESSDCKQCISEFAEKEGCDCMQNESCDVTALIPEGCFPCGDKAMAYCDSEAGKD